MYNTRFKKWGENFDKNRKKGRDTSPIRPINGKRTRPKALDRPNLGRVSTPPSTSILPPLAPKSYRDTEITLVLAGDYTANLLNTFTWDSFQITPPNATTELAQTWKHIGDQIWGATQLMIDGSMSKGMKSFNRVCDLLMRSGVVRASDPTMMVKFWRICHRLNRTDEKILSSRNPNGVNYRHILKSFLVYLRHLAKIYSVKDTDSKQHPFLQLLDAVVRTPQDRLLNTIEVAYRRTIDVMESRLGPQHLTVLEMRSNYLKYWGNKNLARSLFLERYPVLLDSAERHFGRTGKPTIRVLHDFVYAAYYDINDRTLAGKVARDALERVKAMCSLQENLSWDMTTQTYAFTAKLLAIMCLEDGRLVEYRDHLEDAIATLRRGDRQCCTRAFFLAGILRRTLTEMGQLDEAATWSSQRLQIGRRIEDENEDEASANLASSQGTSSVN